MKNLKVILIIFLTFMAWLEVKADAIDSLENVLKNGTQIQEKIYIHTDNTCYFIGDTLWYKAYVLRSDDLKPTNLSKLLYVELLTPDGMLVERQHIVISDNGVTCGQFELKDSLYSGYYELRAYTRWDLNFNVGHRKYTFSDKRKFYDNQLCDDFFREFEGLYSRVLPIYQKPETEGDWSKRYMYRRPKQHMLKATNGLVCQFYPEGGSLVAGLRQRVAFELTDNFGQAMDLEGQLSDGTVVKTTHLGRGVIDITANVGEKYNLTFTCDGKNYTFILPKAQKTGVVLNYNPLTKSAVWQANGVTPKAFAVMCRGRLACFQRLEGHAISLADKDLPTGINELIVYDDYAQPLASRLFFVNNHDMGGRIDVTLTDGYADITNDTLQHDETLPQTIGAKTEVKPFQRLSINAQAEKVNGAFPKTISLSVRDSQTDMPTYDDGNILTDMLLSGDLKGFVASPKYYFSSEDDEHLYNLDLLLMVQGWRKYKRVEKARYLPETGLTYEGRVMKLPSNAVVLELGDLEGFKAHGSITSEEPVRYEYEFDRENHAPRYLKKPVYVEAELAYDGQTAGVVTETDSAGYFRINLPAYYDSAILFVKAYSKSDSLKKCLTIRHKDKEFLDAEAFPDYYVKRDMFFPIFSKNYTWYQYNAPGLLFLEDGDDDLTASGSKLTGNHTLQTIVVTGKRRGKRGIDFSKPAYVRDIYQLYNDVTDYGLSFGVLDFAIFPKQVATFLYGNMGRNNQFNIRAMVEGTSFFRNYAFTGNEFDLNKTQNAMCKMLHLNRMQNVRAYTDYELRSDSCDVEESYAADVTLVFEPIPDDGKRYVYRDRRYIFDGITYPESFYHRSYADDIMQDPNDYRRTLYWNPNARLDENGKFTDVFYNNSQKTRMKTSAVGVNSEGILYHSSQ